MQTLLIGLGEALHHLRCTQRGAVGYLDAMRQVVNTLTVIAALLRCGDTDQRQLLADKIQNIKQQELFLDSKQGVDYLQKLIRSVAMLIGDT